MTRKLYNSKNPDIKYVLYSEKPLNVALSDLDFIVFEFVKTLDSWKALDLPISSESFVEMIKNKEVKRWIKLDSDRKTRRNIKSELNNFTESMNNLTDTSLVMEYCSILEKYPSYLLKEEMGKYFMKNRTWDKILKLEEILNQAKRLSASISYVCSPDIAYGSWKIEDHIIMDEENWHSFRYYKELVS